MINPNNKEYPKVFHHLPLTSLPLDLIESVTPLFSPINIYTEKIHLVPKYIKKIKYEIKPIIAKIAKMTASPKLLTVPK